MADDIADVLRKAASVLAPDKGNVVNRDRLLASVIHLALRQREQLMTIEHRLGNAQQIISMLAEMLVGKCPMLTAKKSDDPPCDGHC